MNELPEKLEMKDGFLCRVYQSGSLPIKGILDISDGNEILRRYNAYEAQQQLIEKLKRFIEILSTHIGFMKHHINDIDETLITYEAYKKEKETNNEWY